MRRRPYITLIFSVCLLIACNQEKEIDIDPDVLYRVTTTEGEGFALFERGSKKLWSGVFYQNEGRLRANAQKVDLETGRELALVDCTGRQIPIISYSRYEEPDYLDFPETTSYRDSMYTVSMTEDVVYGHAQGFWISYPDTGGNVNDIFDAKCRELDDGEKELDLTMDVYFPNDHQTALRPLLILIHGGAFFNGDKADLDLPSFACYFASRGYVVASVNYRLGFRKNLASVKRAGYRAVQDVDAAIRYLIHNTEKYAVDSNRVFLAGTSAGGITALNVAFMKDENIPSEAKEEGGIKTVNSEIQPPYSIRCVGNMWGAVDDLSLLNNASSSVISFHSTGDPVVPYGKGHPFDNVFLNWLVFPTMYGSERITEYLGNQRASLLSYDLPNRHTLDVDTDEYGNKTLNSRFYEIESAMCNFFAERMLPSPVVADHFDWSQTFQIKSLDIESVYWKVQGGVILKQTGNRVDVLLFSNAPSHSVTVCGQYKSGLTFRYSWEL